jgi:hypothetical protein
MVTGEFFRFAGYFPRFAGAFLDGRLSIDVPSDPLERVEELIPSDSRDALYLAYPPLPAIVLMPFVAIFGTAVTTAAACRTVSVLNVLLFDACLERLPKRIGLIGLEPSARMAFDLLFAFGTAAWHNAHMAGDWHLAHAVALAATMLAVREFLGRNRPLVVGGFVALVILTRPTAALVCLFFLLPLVRAKAGMKCLQFSAMPAAAVALLGTCNLARFGDPMDFGYSRMLLSGTGQELMEAYGQFHPHFIPRNFFWFFLAPPWVRFGPPLPVGFDPRGMSLFVACPAACYALTTIRRGWRLPWVRDAAAATVLTLIPLLLYFNTGFWQFGHRFSMDYLAILMMLMVAGIGVPPARWGLRLIAASIVIQVLGILLAPVARLPDWLAF